MIKLTDRQVALLAKVVSEAGTATEEEAQDKAAILSALCKEEGAAQAVQVAAVTMQASGGWAELRFSPAITLPAGEYWLSPLAGTIAPMNPGKDQKVKGAGIIGVFTNRDGKKVTLAQVDVS